MGIEDYRGKLVATEEKFLSEGGMGKEQDRAYLDWHIKVFHPWIKENEDRIAKHFFDDLGQDEYSFMDIMRSYDALLI